MPKRLNYFNNQFLVAQDFIDEQTYHLTMGREHNRLLHTYGIAEGLEVQKVNDQTIRITQGTAIDNQGREIVLSVDQTSNLDPNFPADSDVYVTIAYGEILTDPQPANNPIGETRITEQAVIAVTVTAPPIDGTVIRLARFTLTGNNVPGNVNDEFDGGVRTMAGPFIPDNFITNAKIANNEVNAAKIQDGTVGTNELANNAVTNAKIANDAVNAAKIQNGTVGNAELANNSVTNAKIANNAVNSAKIQDGTVGTNELANNAVTNAKIANDAVNAAKIQNGTVGNAELANNSVTNAKIANDAVNAAKIQNGTVGNAELANNSITNAKIANNAVDRLKLDTSARQRLDNAVQRNLSGSITGSLTIRRDGGSALAAHGTSGWGVMGRLTTNVNSGWSYYPAAVAGTSEIAGLYGLSAIAPSGTYALFVSGTSRFTGAKTGYVVDIFVNASGQRLRTGDIVKLKGTPIHHFQGDNNKIPVPEVTLADEENDNKVIGIVDRETIPDQDTPDMRVKPDDPTFIENGGELLVVTLGSYAHCKVDASKAPIEVGDLLTSSENPGHAKKATDPKIGSIIGKALEPLAEGTGYIAVFVNIQ